MSQKRWREAFYGLPFLGFTRQVPSDSGGSSMRRDFCTASIVIHDMLVGLPWKVARLKSNKKPSFWKFGIKYSSNIKCQGLFWGHSVVKISEIDFKSTKHFTWDEDWQKLPALPMKRWYSSFQTSLKPMLNMKGFTSDFCVCVTCHY